MALFWNELTYKYCLLKIRKNKFYRYAKPPNIKQSHHYEIYTRQLETNHIFIHARYKIQQDYMYTVESWHC